MLRAGKVTASKVADVLSKVKSGESAGRKNYRMDLVAERLTGKPAESFTELSNAMGNRARAIRRELLMKPIGDCLLSRSHLWIILLLNGLDALLMA